MRIVGCFCLILIVFDVFSQQSNQKPKVVNPPRDNNKVKPKVYVDVSKSAQEDAVSFDGVRGIFGLGFSDSNFKASAESAPNFTSSKFNLIDMYLGLEYLKSFKKGFLLGVNVGTDLGKSGKKDGDWNALNEGYEAARGRNHAEPHTGKFRKNPVCPGVSLKGGYLFPKYELNVFLKFTVSRLTGQYTFNSNSREVCQVGVKVLVPSLGMGVERKFNNKWGALVEASFPLAERQIKSYKDEVDHRIKAERINIRLMATYSVSKK